MDLTAGKLRNFAFSKQPFTFLDPKASAKLASIVEVDLLENGSRSAREHWQQAQLENLARHAMERSAFWRERLGNRKKLRLEDLPILTRSAVNEQVAREGSLLRPADGVRSFAHSTSGSTGTPVRFFVSESNSKFNANRSFAQFFIEERDLQANFTRIHQSNGPIEGGIEITREESWLGVLAPVFAGGTLRKIEYDPQSLTAEKLVQVLKDEPVGYSVVTPWIMETIVSALGPGIVKKLGTRMWIPYGGSILPHLRETFVRLEIPIRDNYSSEEVGPIACECPTRSGHYHVVTSNVIVEIVDRKYDVDGQILGRVLVTHLHSYATPFIRYDLGDLAILKPGCPCGHNGPTIANLIGRESATLKLPNGKRRSFYLRARDFTSLAAVREFRLRQTAADTIMLEVVGSAETTQEQIARMEALIRGIAGPEFSVRTIVTDAIDWGANSKRQAFRCELP